MLVFCVRNVRIDIDGGKNTNALDNKSGVALTISDLGTSTEVCTALARERA